MQPLNPTLTYAGLALFPQTVPPGFQIALTHVAVGSAKYDPNGEETSLVNEVARFPIGAGNKASPTAVRIGVTLKDKDPTGRVINDQWIGEIGFYSGSTLFAVWSRADKYLFFKTAEYDVPIAYTLDVSRVPANSVTVTVQLGDAAMQALLFAHEAAVNPHPQYMLITAANGMMAAHLADADPHPQYLTAPEGNALMAAHLAATDPHSQYLTAPEGDSLITAHLQAADPHTQYLTQARGDARYALLGGLKTQDVLKALRGARALRYFHAAGM